MPLNYFESKIDIYKYPAQDTTTNKEMEVTIGDLHGNSLKLLFILLKHNIARLPEEEYREFGALYREFCEQSVIPLRLRIKTAQKCIERMFEIIKLLSFNKISAPFLRLIGDDLADRGACDLITLLLYRKMILEKVAFEVLVSNHGFEFILALEDKVRKSGFNSPLFALATGQGFAHSLETLQQLVVMKYIEPSLLEELYHKFYKPNVKLLSYSLSKDGHEISIYSHAGIGMDTIENLALQFEVEFSNRSAKELANTIDELNKKFAVLLNNGNGHTLATFKQRCVGFSGKCASLRAPQDAFTLLLWNRDYQSLDRRSLYGDPKKDDNWFKVNFIHGHDDREEERPDHVKCVDCNFGYFNDEKDTPLADYVYTIATGLQPRPNLSATSTDGSILDQDLPTPVTPYTATPWMYGWASGRLRTPLTPSTGIFASFFANVAKSNVAASGALESDEALALDAAKLDID